MKDIRNSDGRLVAVIDEAAGMVIIVRHGCETHLHLRSDGTIEVVHREVETIKQ